MYAVDNVRKICYTLMYIIITRPYYTVGLQLFNLNTNEVMGVLYNFLNLPLLKVMHMLNVAVNL